MNRRVFLQSLMVAAAGSTFDLERLLWVPKPMITVPAMPEGFYSLGMVAGWDIAPGRDETWVRVVAPGLKLEDVFARLGPNRILDDFEISNGVATWWERR